MTPATCHPDKPNRGRGLCGTCYSREDGRRRQAAAGQATCHPTRRDRFHGLCLPCYDRSRGYVAPKRIRKYGPYNPVKGRRKRLAKYGLTIAEFDALVAEQGGRCAICHRLAPLMVDHDHATGMRRGLLCNNCNSGLGLFADDPDLLRAAADYLEPHLRTARSA